MDVVTKTREDIEEVQAFVLAVQQTAERKQWQGFDGCTIEHGNALVCIEAISFDGAI